VEKLRQILINFLSNALKFTDEGQIVVKLARNQGADADTLPVSISVADTGIGIPQDRQAQIFEAFSQVDGSTSRRYGGTGLGLTISRELAHLLGGRIAVESSVNRGSTFTLLLPENCSRKRPTDAAPAAAPGGGRATAVASQLPLPAASYPGCRVLLVDDDLRNLLALTPVLESWDISVVAAGDGREALETLRDDRTFDLIFMDLMMPTLDGFETIRQIKQDADLAAVPIIALTAKTADEDRRHALEVGACDFLAKPVETADLKLALDQYLCNPPRQEPS
jgi:two-component system chemotaxis sensor kinase CheA